MIDDLIDALLAAANPITDEQVHGAVVVLEATAANLREQVVAAPHALEEPAPAAPVAAGRSGLPRWGRLVGVAAAAIAVFVAAFVVVGGRGGEERTAWGAEQVAYAEASPLILLDADGWKVTRADQDPGFGGDMTFSDGRDAVNLSWRSDGQTPVLDGLARGEFDPGPKVAVLDATITVARDPGSPVRIAAWRGDGRNLELESRSMPEARFVALVRSLRRVDSGAWLSALPASTVQSIDRRRVVDEMLADVDLPKGFDRAKLTATAQVSDRYQLGARVTSAVACAWLDRWDAAHAAGDQAGMDEASAAMLGSRHWKVLIEMDPDGAFPESLWEIADSMAAGRPATAGGAGPGTGDPRSALGCPGG